MEEYDALCMKILNDLHRIWVAHSRNIYASSPLCEFSIVQISEDRNQSPVICSGLSVGVESWCIKHVYRYACKQLFRYRQALHKRRLSSDKLCLLDKLLLSALLVHADVTTFWNMRREFIQQTDADLGPELLLAELVLSHRSKSNEAFAYRRWIINRSLKGRVSFEDVMMKEYAVVSRAAESAQHNYHAWSHRMWLNDLVFSKTAGNPGKAVCKLVLSPLSWAERHVSEYAGFCYREHVYSLCFNYPETSIFRHMIDKSSLLEDDMDDLSFLNYFLGESKNARAYSLEKQKDIAQYLCSLHHDLFAFIVQLHKYFPTHETVWHYRRSVIYNFLCIAYAYHGLRWQRGTSFVNSISLSTNENIANTNLDDVLQECAEKFPKLLKYEANKVESSLLYKLIMKTETIFIQNNVASGCSMQQKLAKRHQLWLKYILCLDI